LPAENASLCTTLPEKYQRKPQNAVGHAKGTDKILDGINALKKACKKHEDTGKTAGCARDEHTPFTAIVNNTEEKLNPGRHKKMTVTP
jgi:hypothetical protein